VEYAKKSKVESLKKIKISGFKFPGKDLAKNLGNVIRSWITGAVIGFLPGLGGPAASVIAYTNERNLAKDKEEWGKGAIGGVIAPETANNATVGGAMIPMIALGIPGDLFMVQFIAVLNIQGINVGPILMRTNPEVVYMIFTAGIVSGILCLIAEICGMRIFPAILKIPYHYLYPAILVITFAGAYMVTGTMYGLIVCLATCVLGIAMDHFEVPSMPFLLTYILANIFERNVRQAMNFSKIGFAEFFTRPLSCLFIIIGVASLLFHFLMPIIKKARANK